MQVGTVCERLQDARRVPSRADIAKRDQGPPQGAPVHREDLSVKDARDGPDFQVEAQEATGSQLVAHGDDPYDPALRCERERLQVPAPLLEIDGLGKPGKVRILVERSKDELARTNVDHSDGLQGFIVTALEGQLVGHLAANRRLVADVVHLPGAHPETGSRAQ